MKKQKKRSQQKNPSQVREKKRYYYNEHDDNQVEKLATRQKKRRLKKKIAWSLKLGVVVLVIMFFCSPLSRVQKITVTGEHYLSEEEVIAKSGVYPDSIHALTYPYFIEKKLNEVPMIASCKVHRGIFYGIDIEIQERTIIAYELTDDETLRIVDDNGQLVAIDKSHLTEIQQTPRLLNFDDDKILKEFCQELAQVPSAVRSLMSDIIYDPETYDMSRIKINMSDGKIVYVRIENMAGKMKYYQEMLSRCPNAEYFDINGDKSYAKPCEKN